MLVVFESDGENTGDGFMASFESGIRFIARYGHVDKTRPTRFPTGSGNWDYHDNTACLWRVMPEGASSVTLYFTEFETEEGFDFLKIYDLQTQQLIAEYSGSYSPGVPDPVTSPSVKCFLTFNSGTSGTAPGWESLLRVGPG